jgi:hypothetical protein
MEDDPEKRSAPLTPKSPKNSDIEVRERLGRFIKTHYANTLRKDIEILEQPGGLELLHQKYCGSK